MVVGTLEREQRTDRLFFALSDATRRDIVTQTLDRERSVSDLGRLYPISLTAVQKHVEVLVDAGLVSKHRSGREQLVRGEVNQLRRAHELLDELETLWQARLERFEDVLNETTRKGRPMTVWNVDKNAEAKTMVITAEFKASITNVWQLWADPRLLERWWGPPGFPATFEHHDLTPGGTITYYMSGPDGGDSSTAPGTWSRSTPRPGSWSKTPSSKMTGRPATAIP